MGCTGQIQFCTHWELHHLQTNEPNHFDLHPGYQAIVFFFEIKFDPDKLCNQAYNATTNGNQLEFNIMGMLQSHGEKLPK